MRNIHSFAKLCRILTFVCKQFETRLSFFFIVTPVKLLRKCGGCELVLCRGLIFTELRNCQLEHKERPGRMILVDYTPLTDGKLSLRTDKRLSDAVFVRRGETEMAGEQRRLLAAWKTQKSASVTVTSNATESSRCRRLICISQKKTERSWRLLLHRQTCPFVQLLFNNVALGSVQRRRCSAVVSTTEASHSSSAASSQRRCTS